MERLIESDPISRQFNWNSFHRQNLLIEEAFSRAAVDYEMLDAYHINILRPDEHREAGDCLHSCLGSKLDVYAQVLMHILRRRQALENDLMAGSEIMN